MHHKVGLSSLPLLNDYGIFFCNPAICHSCLFLCHMFVFIILNLAHNLWTRRNRLIHYLNALLTKSFQMMLLSVTLRPWLCRPMCWKKLSQSCCSWYNWRVSQKPLSTIAFLLLGPNYSFAKDVILYDGNLMASLKPQFVIRLRNEWQ